ncbi:MAG: hypothetical protein R3C19_09345 [Planctomycetaceae bacterium]
MKRVLTLLLAAVAGISTTSDAQAAPEDSALEKLADLIGEVVDGVNRQRPPVRPAVRMAPAVMREVAPPPPVQEVDARRKRLEAHAAAFLDWTVQVGELSDDEQARLRDVLSDKIRRAQDVWTRNANRRNGPITDFVPVAFTSSAGAAEFLHRSRVGTMLNDDLAKDHQISLAAALEERGEWVRSMVMDYAISLIDEELFLTSEQRTEIRDELSNRIEADTLEEGLFAFSPGSTSYFKFRSLAYSLNLISDSILTDVQRQLHDDSLLAESRQEICIFPPATAWTSGTAFWTRLSTNNATGSFWRRSCELPGCNRRLT